MISLQRQVKRQSVFLSFLYSQHLWAESFVCSDGVKRPAPSLDKLVCCVCPVKHESLLTWVQHGFTWGHAVPDNTELSPSYRCINYNQPVSLKEQRRRCIPIVLAVTLLLVLAEWDLTRFDKHWQLRRGISLTDGYWLSDMVICFSTAAQLISHKETQETLLDCYSERLSVSLHLIPNLIHLPFTPWLWLFRIY